MRFLHLNTFITDKLHLCINGAALLNISAVIYSHIQGASIYKDVKYSVITVPLYSVGNIYETCIEVFENYMNFAFFKMFKLERF